MNQFHRKSLVRILTGGFYFLFAFRFFFALALALTKPELNRFRSIETNDWSNRCQGIDKKSTLLFTIHQNIFINIFPFYIYYLLWRNQPWSFLRLLKSYRFCNSVFHCCTFNCHFSCNFLELSQTISFWPISKKTPRITKHCCFDQSGWQNNVRFLGN